MYPIPTASTLYLYLSSWNKEPENIGEVDNYFWRELVIIPKIFYKINYKTFVQNDEWETVYFYNINPLSMLSVKDWIALLSDYLVF